MAPPTAGVTKRRARTFVRSRAVTTPIAATVPPPPPRLIDTGLRMSPFPLPLPRLPRTGAAEKRTTTPPERRPPQPVVRTTPPAALSMPLLDMETTPPRQYAATNPNPFSPLSTPQPVMETTPPRSYAAVLNTNPESPPHAPPRPSLRTAPTPSPKPVRLQPPLAPASKKIPPIVVDRLPDWPHHLRKLRELLGHIPNARPYGKGVRFLARTEEEFRLYQRYLTTLERATGLSWFAYAPPAERSLKLAIRGLPMDTDVAELGEELRARGFDPQFIRPIQAREGRTGCLFFAEIRRTLGFQRVYEISELLCMPGVKVEAWRGRRGAAQCHRCQQFRHSSHNCHRPAACVRCGENHTAKECLRPREVPATCVNCGGTHPANSSSCPVKLRELRNTKAGAAPMTGARRAAPPAASTVDPNIEPTARSSLMAAANGPAGPKPQRPKRIRKRAKPAPTATTIVEQQPAPTPTPNQAVAAPTKGKKAKPRAEIPPAPSSEKLEVLEQTIQLLHNVLAAIRSRNDPVPIIVGGLASLLGQLTGGH